LDVDPTVRFGQDDEYIARMVVKRKHEFIQGRQLCRNALLKEGCEAERAYVKRNVREPVWPRGYIGTISHSDDYLAVSVKASVNARESIGIDIENPTSTSDKIEALLPCFSASELLLLTQVQGGMMLGFSLKEAIFKCFYRLCRQFIDFHDVELSDPIVVGNLLSFKFKFMKSLGSIPLGNEGRCFAVTLPTLPIQFLSFVYAFGNGE
jgi:enterobactin synthetase component D